MTHLLSLRLQRSVASKEALLKDLRAKLEEAEQRERRSGDESAATARAAEREHRERERLWAKDAETDRRLRCLGETAAVTPSSTDTSERNTTTGRGSRGGATAEPGSSGSSSAVVTPTGNSKQVRRAVLLRPAQGSGMKSARSTSTGRTKSRETAEKEDSAILRERQLEREREKDTEREKERERELDRQIEDEIFSTTAHLGAAELRNRSAS
jgi:hypothetical protein